MMRLSKWRMWLAAAATATLALTVSATVIMYSTRDQLPQAPGDVLDLSNWKLTLPVDTHDEKGPDEVKQPQLSQYSSEFFRLNKARDGVSLRATVGGATTDGSDFARTELREMTQKGTEKAAWSSGSGTHTMTVRQTVDALPTARPAMAVGQIHGGSEYLVIIRLDGQRLYVKADDENKGDLDPSYQLGTSFTLKLEVERDTVRVYYNGELKVELEKTCRTCYFKVGAYLQSNAEWGDRPEAYGQVTIFDLAVSHT